MCFIQRLSSIVPFVWYFFQTSIPQRHTKSCEGLSRLLISHKRNEPLGQILLFGTNNCRWSIKYYTSFFFFLLRLTLIYRTIFLQSPTHNNFIIIITIKVNKMKTEKKNYRPVLFKNNEFLICQRNASHCVLIFLRIICVKKHVNIHSLTIINIDLFVFNFIIFIIIQMVKSLYFSILNIKWCVCYLVKFFPVLII